MCVCACMCYRSGMFGGRDQTGDAQPLYLLYFVLRVYDHKQTHLGSSGWRGHNWGAAAETDTIGEQQLKWTQSGTVQSGHARLVLAGDTMAYCCQCIRTGGYARLTHAWWRRQDLWSMCLQRQKNCCVPHCANTNEGESSSELQTLDCLRRWMRGNSWSEQSYLQWFSAVIEFEYTKYEPTYAHSSSSHSSVNLKV